MRTSAVVIACAVVIATGIPGPASAQGARKGPPSGREISDKAKKVKLDKDNATIADFHGKKMTLTPADLSTVKSVEELEAGQVLGQLENEAAGDETGLPPASTTSSSPRWATSGTATPNPTARLWPRGPTSA